MERKQEEEKKTLVKEGVGAERITLHSISNTPYRLLSHKFRYRANIFIARVSLLALSCSLFTFSPFIVPQYNLIWYVNFIVQRTAFNL